MSDLSLILAATFSALFVSSIAGYGGSLVLVPALGALLGPREGIAFAAVLLAWNNVFKVIAYRETLAIRRGWPLIVTAAVGVFIGARTLIAVSDGVIVGVIIGVTIASLAVEIFRLDRLIAVRRHLALPTMLASSVLSGVSGTSGPLKGVSIRSVALPRLEHVGLAACVSLCTDVIKVELFASAGLLDNMSVTTLVLALPMMPVGAWVGRWVNRRMNEESFRWVFWSVVAGYTMRMSGYWW